MKKREDIIQKFSTFLNFTNANSLSSVSWQVDVELERHIMKIRKFNPEAKEEFWAIHFLKSTLNASQVEDNKFLENNSIFQINKSESLSVDTLRAERHLSAYLQESCLWAAYKVYNKFNLIRHKYPLEEYFQIACMGASPPSKLLKNFNLHYSFFSMRNYAQIALLHFIQNTIYSQDIELKSIKYTDYGLLKDLTKIELKTALLMQGITQEEANLFCLVWKCFDEVYSSHKHQSSRRLKSPNQEQIKQICSCYNLRLQQLNISAIPASDEKIQQILLTCIQAARQYRTKRFVPLDKDENISEFQPNNLDNIIQEDTCKQVLSIISNIFLALPESGQIILKLCKGLNLTQSEIATILKGKYSDLQKQYQVARQLAKYNRDILKDFLTQWQLVEPDMKMNNEKDIEQIKEALDECLELYCKKVLNNYLELVFDELINENNNINAIINKKVTLNINKQLVQGFYQKLEEDMSLPNKSLESLEYKISAFVENWLRIKNYSVNYLGDKNDARV